MLAHLYPHKKLPISGGPTEEEFRKALPTATFQIAGSWHLVTQIRETLEDEQVWLIRGEGCVLGQEQWHPIEGFYAPAKGIGQIQCM